MMPSTPVYQLKRRAKLMARSEGIPLHAALDRVARGEGCASWGLLSSRLAAERSPTDLLPRLAEGDVLLVGARPGHGKTRLGLQLLADAARENRRAVLFTLEYSEREARDRLRALRRGGDAAAVGSSRRTTSAPPRSPATSSAPRAGPSP